MNVMPFIVGAVTVGAGLTAATRRSAVRQRAKSVADRTSDRVSVDAIDAYVERHMKRLRVPGAALAIVQDDRIVHLRGFGRARPHGELPFPQTPFILGSTTKSITALAMMQLVEAGKVELDAPVQRYLSWFRVADPEASAQMTVRHLLNQTSGLSQVSGMGPMADMDESPSARERQARAMATLRLSHPPGAAWEYSNMNYLLLGLIIEAVTGMSYEAYIREHVFTPLDMQHSYTSRQDAEHDALAMGHRYWFGVPIPAPNVPIPRGLVPGGYLISSAEDMGHYLIAHLNEGRFRDSHVSSPAGISELQRPSAPVEVLGKSMGAYAMGWFVEDVGGETVLWHDGVVPDFYSYMALVPEQKRGIILLINANHLLMTLAFREVGGGLAQLLAGRQPDPIRLAAIPWVLRALPLLPLLQIVGVTTSLQRSGGEGGPIGRQWRPLMPSLVTGLLSALALLAALHIGVLRVLLLFMPDVSWTALTSSSVGLLPIIGVLRGRTPQRSPNSQRGNHPVHGSVHG